MDAVRVPLARTVDQLPSPNTKKNLCTRPVFLGNIEQAAYHTKICLSLLRIGKNLCTVRLGKSLYAPFGKSLYGAFCKVQT